MLASGRNNYYDKGTHQWYDTVMAIYEYETAQGPVSAYYQTITTNSGQGYFEMFMGHEGTLLRLGAGVALPDLSRDVGRAESKWDPWAKKGYLGEPVAAELKPKPAVHGGDGRPRLRAASSVSPAGDGGQSWSTSRTWRTSSTRFAARRS